MAAAPFFDILFTVSDLPPLVFSWLDSTSLALAACVCKRWREAARLVLKDAMFRPSFKHALSRRLIADWMVQGPMLLSTRLKDVACHLAARYGHLGALRMAKNGGCPLGISTCVSAAENGHFTMLVWARKNGCPWDERICSGAAENGHFGILKWARNNGCPWNEQTCNAAAANGRLKILRWARENGCTWSVRTCSYAAGFGHLDVLMWAVHNGCPWDVKSCRMIATMNKHKGVVFWIAQWCARNRIRASLE
jgi:hypothetical protein